MNPTNFHDQTAKTSNNSTGLCPPPLKVNKDSHMIVKKSSSSSQSSSNSSCLGVRSPAKPPQQRHPVIIYTHSPKVIHTQPKDFMALVQKLTGLSGSVQGSAHPPLVKEENGNGSSEMEVKSAKNVVGGDDNESSSVITEENCGSDGQVNSCFVPTINFDPPNAFMTNLPVFPPNPPDLICENQSFYNYTDSLFFNPPNVGSLEGFNEFREY